MTDSPKLVELRQRADALRADINRLEMLTSAASYADFDDFPEHSADVDRAYDELAEAEHNLVELQLEIEVMEQNESLERLLNTRPSNLPDSLRRDIAHSMLVFGQYETYDDIDPVVYDHALRLTERAYKVGRDSVVPLSPDGSRS